MKTNRQSFESATASDSNDLIELDESSLSQVAGGASASEIHITKEVDKSSPKLFQNL
jgi:type VI protein secretion system component Hcp